jgi:hypothetical protein
MDSENNNMQAKPYLSEFIDKATVRKDLFILFALWSISLIVVNPIGNFPLNDDWSFALTVNYLLQHGEYRPTGWASMPLITNALWGSLFCLPAGFSFNALRGSTLVAALIGIGGMYWLIRELRLPRWLAIVAALTLGFNPLYYLLANTFMTDVLYTALQILAAAFFARHLRSAAHADLIIGTALALAATLSRQLALAVPLAFAVSLVLTHGFNRATLLRAVIPAAVCITALAAFEHWLAAAGRLSPMYYQNTNFLLQMLATPKVLILALIANSYGVALYLGLFLFPVLLIITANSWRIDKGRTKTLLSIATATVFAATGILYGGRVLMPLMGNVMQAPGIGPFTLRDAYILHTSNLPELPASFWLAVTAIGMAGSILLLAAVLRALGKLRGFRFGKMAEHEAAGFFLLLSAAAYLLPLLASIPCDRYLIPALPLFMAGFFALLYPRLQPNSPQLNQKPLRYSVLAVIVVFFGFAILSAKDYLAWNRLRWEATRDLARNHGATVAEIDGGLEFNGLYAYDPDYQKTPDKSWWWVQDDAYLISFKPLLGYTVLKEYTYTHWLPYYQGKVLALKRDSAQNTPWTGQ